MDSTPGVTSNEEILAFLKEKRVDIENIISQLKDQGAYGSYIEGRENSLAITKLQEAKMWLGQVIGDKVNRPLPPEFQDKATI